MYIYACIYICIYINICTIYVHIQWHIHKFLGIPVPALKVVLERL